jgi:hypothetical protein
LRQLGLLGQRGGGQILHRRHHIANQHRPHGL